MCLTDGAKCVVLQVRVKRPNVFIHNKVPVNPKTKYSEVNHTNIILLQCFFRHRRTLKHFQQGLLNRKWYMVLILINVKTTIRAALAANAV